MARYSSQFRNNVLRKLLPPQSKTVGEIAAEFRISTVTIYGWKAKMNDGTLQVDDGAQGARHRQLTEKLKGSRAGQHRIRINDQWRICFRRAGTNAYDVEIVDYH